MGDVSLPTSGGSSTHTPKIVTIQSDNSPLPAGVTLTETNYALWSQVMEKSIVAQEKLGYLTELDHLRVHLFLSGLDPEFDQVRGEILCKDPKLDLDQTFVYVRREAQQRMTMISAKEASVVVTQRQMWPQTSTGGSSQNKASGSRPKKKCTHYEGDKHTRAGCYELIGYPDR
ncbi:hypothetical protein L3X38_005468 [Prunus dulcis]|uniref:Retrotransposon Copia-like N-terminal domain-containing protein n=1 Tax=Prunus dulcis TaxID=3755 RepID=A0AAD5F450_PRUDU|nr:hypothetical protein L3X38_005468 [Prunus dulcis]